MEKWYIVHTRPRWEKKVTDSLEQKGIESYCPVKKVRRRWSDRIKTIEEPVFRSFVFVKIAPEQRTNVRISEGVVNFLHRQGKLVQVKEKEIKALKKHLLERYHSMVMDTNTQAIVKEEIEKNKGTEIFQSYLDRFRDSFFMLETSPN